jgi:3-vinyl bacteriochlorophyllide hydratase
VKVSMEQVRARRQASVWTKVHPIFALGQLGAFVVSVILLFCYFRGWVSFDVVQESVLVKIALMIGAIVSGAFWERDVYGQYWFADQFFFEDCMTINVLLLHVGYLVMTYANPQAPEKSVVVLCLAYAVYVANVAQYIFRNHKMTQIPIPVEHGGKGR